VARRNRRRLRTRRDDSAPPPRQPVRVYVTVAVPRQFVWLVTGVAIGKLRLLDEISVLVRGLV
jgi:hypothetical protein